MNLIDRIGDQMHEVDKALRARGWPMLPGPVIFAVWIIRLTWRRTAYARIQLTRIMLGLEL